MATVETGPDATAADAVRAPLFAAPATANAAGAAPAAVALDPATAVAATPPMLAPGVVDGDTDGAGSSAMVVTPPPRKRGRPPGPKNDDGTPKRAAKKVGASP